MNSAKKVAAVVLIRLPLAYSIYRLDLFWFELALVLMGLIWSVLILRMKGFREGEYPRHGAAAA